MDVDADDEEEGEETTPEAAPRVERRQGEEHEIAWAAKPGRCVMCRCHNSMAGCKTCGVRLCGGCSANGFGCINKHICGVKGLFTPKVGIDWWVPDEE